MQNAPENPTVVVGNHFATLPTYVVPSFCACLQPVVSLGPHEGATTHHYRMSVLYVWRAFYDENKFELLDVCSESEIHIVPTGKPHIRHHEALMVGRVVRGMYGGIWDSYSLIPHFLVGHDY